MSSLHAHVQVEYTVQETRTRDDGKVIHSGSTVETLIGFNPTNEEDRKMLHGMLDEFLDLYLIPKFKKGEQSIDNDAKFIVYGTIDSH